MPLADAYPLIKSAHIGLAMASGGLFALRGAGVLAGASLPMAPPVRRLSQVVDTALLVAALLLLSTLQLNPLVTPWLQAKLALLLAYIVFGTLALKRAPSMTGKVLAYVAALACFAMIVAIARTHDPLGFLPFLA
jgi:uncharacterized membrane protein SirB2